MNPDITHSTTLCFKHLRHPEEFLLVNKYVVDCLFHRPAWSHIYLVPELLTESRHRTTHWWQQVHVASQCSGVLVSTGTELAQQYHFVVSAKIMFLTIIQDCHKYCLKPHLRQGQSYPWFIASVWLPHSVPQILTHWGWVTQICVFYITTVQDGWRKSAFLTHACSPCTIHLTFRYRASCILGQALHYSPENAFYIFNRQIYLIIWYLLDRASLI